MRKDFKEIAERQKEMVKENNSETFDMYKVYGIDIFKNKTELAVVGNKNRNQAGL